MRSENAISALKKACWTALVVGVVISALVWFHRWCMSEEARGSDYNEMETLSPTAC